MCDRTKREVLARELAFEYYSGQRAAMSHMYTGIVRGNPIVDSVENTYQQWLPVADRIISTLAEHNVS